MEIFEYSDLETLDISLPEDIKKRKWAGEKAQALKLIDIWLTKPIPNELKKRLRLERQILPVLYEAYPLTKAEALKKIIEAVPDMTEEEFDMLRDNGEIDWMFVEKEERYFGRFLATLLKVNKDIQNRYVKMTKTDEIKRKEEEALSHVLRRMKEQKQITYRIRLRHEVSINEEAFHPGMVRVHIPFVLECEGVSDIKIHAVSQKSYCLADASQAQRTIYFEKDMKINEPFFIEYEYCIHREVFEEGKPFTNLNKELPSKSDLAQKRPHIVFTPYLKALAQQIVEKANTPYEKAKAIYDYVTKTIHYSFMREYLTLENIPEYCALSNRGDCGVQTLLFITLCRICGIPTQWQSGLYVTPYTGGSHDWAKFYTSEYGWLHVDCSFGCAAQRENNEEKRKFYFGNLDPFRMPANREFQEEFYPAKNYLRSDPFDNQRGEIEYEDRGLKYNEYEETITILRCEEESF